mmetsp:Transcript_6589/g.5682  ORF Transcript_6589/g.5682 Transcript_6589/m.5682 type:complete len:89 (+) Transcript_6589:235-501(+)
MKKFSKEKILNTAKIHKKKANDLNSIKQSNFINKVSFIFNTQFDTPKPHKLSARHSLDFSNTNKYNTLSKPRNQGKNIKGELNLLINR